MHKYSNFLQNGNIMQLCVIDKKIYDVEIYKKVYKKLFIYDKNDFVKVHGFEIYMSLFNIKVMYNCLS